MANGHQFEDENFHKKIEAAQNFQKKKIVAVASIQGNIVIQPYLSSYFLIKLDGQTFLSSRMETD